MGMSKPWYVSKMELKGKDSAGRPLPVRIKDLNSKYCVIQ